MNTSGQILSKIFAIRFYRNNASLFLLVLVFAAGFMRSQDHLALAEYFIRSPYLLLIPITVWIGYAWYVSDFNSVSVGLRENFFLYHFIHIPIIDQWKLCVLLSMQQFVPVFAYGFFLISISLKYSLVIPIVTIFLAMGVLVIYVSWKLRMSLRNPASEKHVTRLKLWLGKKWIKPFVIFPIEWALRNQLIALIAFKLFSMAILWSTLFLYTTEEYDLRLAGIGVIFAFAGNITFILGCHRFIHFHFSIFRQMPFSILKQYGLQFLTIVVFSIPESVMLFRNFPEGFQWYSPFMIYCMGLSLNLLFYNFLFTKDRPPEKVMTFVYVVTTLLFLLILCDVPQWILALLNVGVSFWIMKRYSGRFEYTGITV